MTSQASLLRCHDARTGYAAHDARRKEDGQRCVRMATSEDRVVLITTPIYNRPNHREGSYRVLASTREGSEHGSGSGDPFAYLGDAGLRSGGARQDRDRRSCDTSSYTSLVSDGCTLADTALQAKPLTCPVDFLQHIVYACACLRDRGVALHKRLQRSSSATELLRTHLARPAMAAELVCG